MASHIYNPEEAKDNRPGAPRSSLRRKIPVANGCHDREDEVYRARQRPVPTGIVFFNQRHRACQLEKLVGYCGEVAQGIGMVDKHRLEHLYGFVA